MEELKFKIAPLLYETYCAAVGGIALNGDLLPKWEEFRDDPSKRKQSDAWLLVAEEAIIELYETRPPWG